MKRILRWSVLMFILLFIAAPLAYTEPIPPPDDMEKGLQHWGPFCGKPPMMPCDMGHMKEMQDHRHCHFMHFKSLNLDEKQNDALKEIENDTVKELIRKRADEQIAEIELQELLEKDIVDLKVVEKKLKQIEVLKTDSRLIFIKSTEKMKAKLTPEQLKMLKKIRPMDHPGMRPPVMGEVMHDEIKMPPSSSKEREE